MKSNTNKLTSILQWCGLMTSALTLSQFASSALAANSNVDFQPIQMELCTMVNMATGNLLDPNLSKAVSAASNSSQKNLEELLKVGGPLLSKLNEIDRTKSVLADGEKSKKFTTLGSVLGYILSVIQNSLNTKHSGSLTLNFLPNQGCKRLVNLNNKANGGKESVDSAIYLSDLIWNKNIPSLPPWTTEEMADEDSTLRKILPYIQIAGLNLNIDSTGSFQEAESNISGSVVLMFPKYFSYPLKDMYTLGGELRMDKFFFDEYKDGALHMLVVSFDKLKVTKTAKNEIAFNENIRFNIDFTGGANIVFNSTERSTSSRPSVGRFHGIGKPSHAARISLKPTRVENMAKNSAFVENLMRNFLIVNLNVKHFEAGIKTVVNSETGNPEYYPELELKDSIDASLGTSTGNHYGKNYYASFNVDKQAQGAIDALNMKVHGYVQRFYTEIRDSILQYNKEIKTCLEKESSLDDCSRDLQSEFDLP